jgi:hypothetical protein
MYVTRFALVAAPGSGALMYTSRFTVQIGMLPSGSSVTTVHGAVDKHNSIKQPSVILTPTADSSRTIVR